MKYLQKSFSMFVTERKEKPFAKFFRRDDDNQRAKLAKQPHAFVNSGTMCGVCCLAREAKIHD